LAQRSRKHRPGAGPSEAVPEPNAGMKRGYARGEARNARIREGLEPLGPGERPRAVVIAAVVATLLGLLNLVFLLAGYEVRGEQPALPGVLILSSLLIAAAVGMWKLQYWAILGFQALLGISLAVALLSLLITVQDLRGIAVSVFILITAGSLFWFLVKAMARIQMPDRPRRSQA
jgi:hypothetical protein